MFCSKIPLNWLQTTECHIKPISAASLSCCRISHTFSLSPTDFACHYTESAMLHSQIRTKLSFLPSLYMKETKQSHQELSCPLQKGIRQRKTLYLLSLSANSFCSQTRLSFRHLQTNCWMTLDTTGKHTSYFFFYISACLRGERCVKPNWTTVLFVSLPKFLVAP